MTNAPTGRHHFTSIVLAAIFVVLAAAGQADALCLDNLRQMPAPSKSPGPLNTVPFLHAAPAVYRPGAASGQFLRVGDSGDKAGRVSDEPIVGLWEFEISGNVPPDFGTQAWHSDGTELMFSAGRNPATGDICQGVWKKIGPRTYSLNHIAMGWDFGSFGVRVHIHAVVEVDASGDTYTGSLTAAVYSVTPADPFDESVLVGSGTGTITGTRVRPD